MYHVYILRSVKFKKQTYVGFTENLEERLKSHNYGQVPYTAEFKPWEIVMHVTFQNKEKAVAFEK